MSAQDQSSNVAGNTVQVSLFHACHAPCPRMRKHMLDSLQSYEQRDGYLMYLTRLVNVHDIGAHLSLDCRTLAAILLKNAALKWWPYADPANPQHEQQKAELVSFLTSYLDEPQCSVAFQLHCLTAQLLRLTWPDQFRGMLCAFVQAMAKEPSALVCYR
ncbi:hypothetical protein EON65_32740, partial [archaeon]